MKLSEAKKLLIETMRQKESLHFVLGWLQHSYYYKHDDEIEMAVVTNMLKEYGVEI